MTISIAQTPEVVPAVSRDPDRHFRTEHLLGDLKLRSIRGGAVTVTAQLFKFTVQLGATAALARLLSPADFGLVGMVLPFTGFVELFRDLGLSTATVQRAQITHEQVSTLFWINIAASVLLAAVGFALAPALVWFYGEPRLLRITLALSVAFVLGAVGAQHGAILRRQMRFNAVAIVDVGSYAVGFAAAIAAALLGGSYWALVVFWIVSPLTNSVAAWTLSGWTPGLPWRRKGTRELVRFGGNLTGFNLLNYLSRNLDNVLIGRASGAAALGLYARAYSLLTLPLNQIIDPLAAVTMPALSRVQEDPKRFRNGYLKFLTLVATFGIPCVALLIVLSRETILVVLGTKWVDAVPIYRILGFAGLIQPLVRTTGVIFMASGQTRRMFRLGIWLSSVTVASFIIGLPFGVLGIATAYSLCSWLAAPFVFRFTLHGTSISMTDVGRCVWRAAIVAGAVCLAATGSRALLAGRPPVVILLAGSAVSGIVWLSLNLALSRELHPSRWIRDLL